MFTTENTLLTFKYDKGHIRSLKNSTLHSNTLFGVSLARMASFPGSSDRKPRNEAIARR